MDCGPPDSSVHGTLQTGVLEWVAIFLYRGSSWPKDRTCISCVGRRILYHWSTTEALTVLHVGVKFGFRLPKLPWLTLPCALCPHTQTHTPRACFSHTILPCPHKFLGSCLKAIDFSFLRLMGHACHQCWELTSHLLQSFQQFIFFRNTSDRELMVFYSYAYFLISTHLENSDLFFSCLFPCIFWETLFIIFS